MATFDMTLLHTSTYAYDIAHEENAMSSSRFHHGLCLRACFYYKKFAATNKQLREKMINGKIS